MIPDLKFETKEEMINGEKVLRYFINKKEVDVNTYNTLKPDYDKHTSTPLPHSSKPKQQQKEFSKLDIDDINDEDYPDDTEEDCVCPTCDAKYSILDLINIVGSQNLSLEYLEECLEDILSELYETAFKDGHIQALLNISNLSVDIANSIMDDTFEEKYGGKD